MPHVFYCYDKSIAAEMVVMLMLIKLVVYTLTPLIWHLSVLCFLPRSASSTPPAQGEAELYTSRIRNAFTPSYLG